MGVYSSFSLQNVTNISAHTHTELESAPLILSLEGEDWQHGRAEITIHTENPELSLALVAAINGAIEAVKAKQTVAEIAA